MTVLDEAINLYRSNHRELIEGRFEGLSTLAREFDRLQAAKPDSLKAAIAVLELWLTVNPKD